MVASCASCPSTSTTRPTYWLSIRIKRTYRRTCAHLSTSWSPNFHRSRRGNGKRNPRHAIPRTALMPLPVFRIDKQHHTRKHAGDCLKRMGKNPTRSSVMDADVTTCDIFEQGSPASINPVAIKIMPTIHSRCGLLATRSVFFKNACIGFLGVQVRLIFIKTLRYWFSRRTFFANYQGPLDRFLRWLWLHRCPACLRLQTRSTIQLSHCPLNH